MPLLSDHSVTVGVRINSCSTNYALSMVLIGPQKCLFGCVCTTMGSTSSAYTLRLPHNIARLSSKCLAEGNTILVDGTYEYEVQSV